jgi:hypothetical protein
MVQNLTVSLDLLTDSVNKMSRGGKRPAGYSEESRAEKRPRVDGIDGTALVADPYAGGEDEEGVANTGTREE